MFQQRMLNELNEVVLQHQSELGRLRNELDSLRALAERAIELSSGDHSPESPPHF